MSEIFKVFAEGVGVEGYYQIIRSKLFPNSTAESVDATGFWVQEQFFRKGSLFSRVRSIQDNKVQEFLDGRITKNEFYPPKPKNIHIPQGRFNEVGQRTFYLADHPLVAMRQMPCQM